MAGSVTHGGKHCIQRRAARFVRDTWHGWQISGVRCTVCSLLGKLLSSSCSREMGVHVACMWRAC